MKQTWECSCCGDELVLKNCDMVKSMETTQGVAYSRSQPGFNLQFVTGANLVGVNMWKLQELLFGHLAIKISADCNLRKMQTKVKAGVKATYEERKDENRKEHCAATRSLPNYHGDIVWEKDGEKHSTSCGDVSGDGAGATRFYGNKSRGRQSAYVANSRVTGKPLALVVSQVSVLFGLSIL